MKLTIDTTEGTLTSEAGTETSVLDLYSKEAFQLISQQWLKIGWNQKERLLKKRKPGVNQGFSRAIPSVLK